MNNLWFIITTLYSITSVAFRIIKTVSTKYGTGTIKIKRIGFISLSIYLFLGLLFLAAYFFFKIDNLDAIFIMVILVSFCIFIFEIACFFSDIHMKTSLLTMFENVTTWTFITFLCAKYKDFVFTTKLPELISIVLLSSAITLFDVFTVIHELLMERKENLEYVLNKKRK